VRILKRVLLGLGSFCGLIIVVAIVLAMSSAHFKTQQAPFVTSFVIDLSHRWKLADVQDRLSDHFIEQASSAEGQLALRRISTLGALRSVQDLEIRNYSMMTNGTTAVFAFKGTFDNDVALVTVTVLRKSGTVRVMAFHIDPIPGRTVPSPARVQT